MYGTSFVRPWHVFALELLELLTVKAMQQEQSSENKADNNRNNQEPGTAITPFTGTAIAIWVFVIGGAILWLVIHDNVADAAKGFEVFIASIFSLALVIVVVIQAGIYFRQARALDAQLEVSGDSLVISQQSYVGICSIADRTTPQGDIILIKLENIGHVPADEIAVNIHLNGLLLDRAIIPPDVRTKFGHAANEHFGRTKLFPGKLKIEIVLPYDKYVSPSERMLIDAGRMAFYVWGKVVYQDGFGKGKETEFSFYHRRDGRWIVAAPWSPNVIEMLEREQSHKRPNSNE